MIPRPLTPWWLCWTCMLAAGVAWPFYWLWHPLGWVVAVVAELALFAGLCASDRNRRRRGASPRVEASARVRSRRG